MTTASAIAAPPPQVGDHASFETTIDAAMVDAFAQLSGDRNPLHVDAHYASTTAFGERVAHGMIAGALCSRLIGMNLPGTSALYRSQKLRFLAPIRLGTRVRVSGKVARFERELSLLTVRIHILDAQVGTLYVDGDAEVLVREESSTAAQGYVLSSGESLPVVDELRREREPTNAAAPHATGSDLVGLRALVIGGSRGIGAAIAREISGRGAELIVGYHKGREHAEHICTEARAAGRSASVIQLELRDASGLRASLEEACRTAPIDILVHAGQGEILHRGVDRLSGDDLRDAFQRSVEALHEAVLAVLPGMKARGAGSIVALSSSVTKEPPPPGWAAYTAAKCALVGYVRSLSVELGPFGIRANLVSPVLTTTDANLLLPPRIREELAARSPLGRLPTPEDVARAVAHLVSPSAAYLTGIDLPVAGGMVMT